MFPSLVYLKVIRNFYSYYCSGLYNRGGGNSDKMRAAPKEEAKAAEIRAEDAAQEARASENRAKFSAEGAKVAEQKLRDQQVRLGVFINLKKKT